MKGEGCWTERLAVDVICINCYKPMKAGMMVSTNGRVYWHSARCGSAFEEAISRQAELDDRARGYYYGGWNMQGDADEDP